MARGEHSFGNALSIFWRNWITIFGSCLTTATALLILGFLLLGLTGLEQAAYVGIIAFLILPAFFVAGLLIIPAGLYWDRRQRLRHGDAPREASAEPYPKIDFNKPRVRKTAAVVGFLTLVNVFILSTATYHGVVFMDSVTFCGTVCHTVMEPTHTAYLDSPHSRVKCVECHIGSGAPWFVRSKLSGVRQLFAVTFDTYQRPIPAPVEHLRPSRETCEECHWPEKFTGDRMHIVTKFQEDEDNTPLQTVMLMHVGGGASQRHGTHSWHIDPDITTTYWTRDRQRQTIDVVRVEYADGTVDEYVAEGVTADEAFFAEAEERVMDCIDCHNRPTHIFNLPDRAMDEAMLANAVSSDIPYIKRQGARALRATTGEPGDLEEIAESIEAFYRAEYPDLYDERPAELETAIAEIQAIYRRNVFPKMDVTWGTYPDNRGHTEWPGCFRCHTDAHSTAEGKTISQDCMICHSILAWDEHEPTILSELGIQ